MIEVDDIKLGIKPAASSVLATVSGFLTDNRIESYLVGGFVRDALLGRDTADIDIALAADAMEIASQIADITGGKFVPLDEENRVGRVILTGRGAAPDTRLELDFSTRKGTIENDLAQRDFTIAAMAIDIGEIAGGRTNFHLIDPLGGHGDLRRGIVRAVSETALASDAVRLLRAVRLAAELGFDIDKDTEALIRRDSHLASGICGERAREELLRLMEIPHNEHLLFYLDEMGLVTTLIPELSRSKETTQPKEHFWDVFNHSLQTVAAVDFLLRQGSWPIAAEAEKGYDSRKIIAAVPWSAELAEHFGREVSQSSTRRSLLKVAALLHDVAKPQTKTIEADGRMRFLEHAKEGAVTAATVLERLRFSGKEIKLVETLVRHHLRPTQMSHSGLPSRRSIYRYFRDVGDASIDTLYLNLADHLATRGPHLDFANWREHTDIVEYVLAQHQGQQEVVSPPKLVDGNDLIGTFSLKPGPGIGKLLETVREAQAAGEINSREEALDYIRSQLPNETGQ